MHWHSNQTATVQSDARRALADAAVQTAPYEHIQADRVASERVECAVDRTSHPRVASPWRPPIAGSEPATTWPTRRVGASQSPRRSPHRRQSHQAETTQSTIHQQSMACHETKIEVHSCFDLLP